MLRYRSIVLFVKSDGLFCRLYLIKSDKVKSANAKSLLFLNRQKFSFFGMMPLFVDRSGAKPRLTLASDFFASYCCFHAIAARRCLFLLACRTLFQRSGILNTISSPGLSLKSSFRYWLARAFANAVSSLFYTLQCIVDFLQQFSFAVH